MRYVLCLLLVGASAVFPAQSSGEEAKGTRITLSATVSEHAPNDEVVVSYRIVAKGTHARQLQRDVNGITAKVTARLKAEKVRHTTTNRTLTPVWDSGFFTTKSWEMTQAGRIETQDIDALASWLADIEAAGAKLDHLQFQVSDNRRKGVEDRLRIQAIRDFRARAANIAKGLGVKSFRIIDMNTNVGGEVRPMLMRSESYMAKSTSSEPALTAGESIIAIMISGTIETPYTDYPIK